MTNIPIGHASNLTLMAGKALEKGSKSSRVFESGSFSAEILSGNDIPDGRFTQNPNVTVYVIVTGDSLIEEAEGDTVVATAGDVIFVPGHVLHRFRQRSRQFKTWKMSFSHNL